MTEMMYFDNAATTRPYQQVIEHIKTMQEREYANASSLHRAGLSAEKCFEKAAVHVADALHTDPDRIVFTSGGTESNNLAIFGYLRAHQKQGRHIIVSKTEHPAVLEPIEECARQGYEVTKLDVDKSGRIDVQMLADAIRTDTVLVAIMAVNNETGAMQPIEQIGAILKSRERPITFLCDAVQAFGRIPLHPAKMGIDLLSVSAHKIHGPKGVGALYIDPDCRLTPLFYGGGQQHGLRSGTLNVPAVSGFGKAVHITFEQMKQSREMIEKMRERTCTYLREHHKDAIVLSESCAAPHILNVCFPNVKAEVLMHHLETYGIFVSTGSACSSHGKRQSAVLQAMKVENAWADGSIRISFSGTNALSQLPAFFEALSTIIPRISISHVRRRRD